MNAQVVMFVITSERPVSFMQIEYYRCVQVMCCFSDPASILFLFSLNSVIFRDKVSEDW